MGSKEKVLRRDEIAINSGYPGWVGSVGSETWEGWQEQVVKSWSGQGKALQGQTREERTINWRHKISWACPRDSQT